MTRLKPAARCFALLLVLQSSFFIGAARAEAPKPALPAAEVEKQAEIYRSRGVARPEGYVIDRSLLSYAYTLPAEFNGALAGLGAGDRWLDIGAGEGNAVLDYSTAKYDVVQFKGRERPDVRARAVAMSIEDRRTPRWHDTAANLEDKQIQYVFGRSLRDYSREELGRFNVISDVMGGFSYTKSLSAFMEKTLDFLEVGGTFYSVLQDVHAEDGSNRPHYEGSPFLTEIVKADGSEMRICSWLKSIGCVEVTCELKPSWTPPIEIYRVHKVCDKVSVPNLEPVHFEAGTPPERRFRLMSPPAPQTTATR